MDSSAEEQTAVFLEKNGLLEVEGVLDGTGRDAVARDASPETGRRLRGYREGDWQTALRGLTQQGHDADESDLFLEPAWFLNLSRVVDLVGSPVLYSVRSTDSPSMPDASFPMRAVGGAAGRRLEELSHPHSPLFGPIRHQPFREATELAESFVDTVSAERPRWDVIGLDKMDPTRPWYGALRAALRNRGWWVQEYYCYGNWYLPTDGVTFDRYMADRPSSLRNTVRRKTRQFLRQPGGRLAIYDSPRGLEEGISAYERVWNRSWKRPDPNFHVTAEWMRRCAERGWLRLGVAWLGGTPAAAQLWAVHRGTAYIHNLCFDEDLKAFSPGTILTARLMERVLDEDRVREVDYLIGDEPYKRKWMTHRRERWGLRAFNPRTPKGIVQGGWNIGGSWAKRRLRSLVPGKAG